MSEELEYKEDEGFNDFLYWNEEMNFLSEKSKENIVFDGRRYFWKINENNEVTERVC